MFNPIDTLLREIEELKKKVQKLEDDQIKQNRDYKDMMYNLDTDNIPKLEAVVKKVNLVVSEDGNVTAKFIMEVVNNSSNAEIRADRILLDGGTVLLGDKIKATSDGKMTMESAEIKQNCVLASDLTSGEGMKIGKTFEEDWATIASFLRLFEESGATNKGIEFVTQEIDPETGEGVEQAVTLSNICARLQSRMTSGNGLAQVEIGPDSAVLEASSNDHNAAAYVGNDRVILQFDNVYLQVDGQGVHCGNGKNTMEIYQAL